MKRNTITLRDAHKVEPTKLSYIITIPKYEDEGFLCFAEGDNHIPFPIKRFYYISDVISGAERGFHAHHETAQVLFCIKGAITIILDNGEEREKVILKEAHKGILLDKMMWHEMVDFTPNTVLLVVASDYYKKSDYIRDYPTFLKLAKEQKNEARFADVLKNMFFSLKNHFHLGGQL